MYKLISGAHVPSGNLIRGTTVDPQAVK